MLEIRNLEAGYGETQVIHGLGLRAGQGRVLSILGRNGAGKTTTLKSIVGLVRPKHGSIEFRGHAITSLTNYQIARLGIAYVPETRDIFPSLTVKENLELATRLEPVGERRWTLERVYDFFPRLYARRGNGGNQLSGGEQQMLAIARALLMNPLLLLLDEPSEGLAPIIVKQIHDKLAELKAEGLSMILVEQNFGFATSLADDICIVGRGQAVWSGSPAQIRADSELKARWLGV
jgi:branched-chain amino acid transport system ATP-binding protein